MISLYDQNREVWDTIANNGMPEIREVAKQHTMCRHMDHVFGYKNAVAHWMAGRSKPSAASARIARVILERDAAKVDIAPTVNDATAVPLLVVSGTPAARRKLESLAKMLGCETVEI